MKILKILLAILLLLAAVFFLGAYLLPDQVRVTRQIDIQRPPAQVFAVVNDLRRFNEWSPWFDLDPEAEYRFDGAEQGVGAQMHWSGNDAAGKGSQLITASEAPSRVAIDVRFEGFPVPAQTELRIEPSGDQASRVDWTFQTELKGPLARWFGLMMPGYIGADYEKGLSRLKSVVEAQPVLDFSDLQVSEADIGAADIVLIAGEAPVDDMAATSAALGDRYGQLLVFAAEQSLEIVGQPLTLTDELGGEVWRFQAALPVRAAGPVSTRDAIEFQRLMPTRALVLEHVGPYDQLAATLRRLDAYAVANGFRRAGPIRSIYVSDPEDTPPEALLTRLIYPVAEPAQR